MNLDALKQIRNVLLRTALISLILTWLLAALTVGLWDTWAWLVSQWLRTPVAAFGPLMSNWFAAIKFYLIFVLFVPALAMHWEIKKLENKPSN